MKKNKLAVIMMVLFLACLVSACASKPQAGSESRTGSESLTDSESRTDPESLTGSESRTESTSAAEYDALSNIGITLYLPDEYENSTGLVIPMAQDVSRGEGIYVAYVDYAGATNEAYQELLEKDDATEDEISEFNSKVVPLLNFVVIDQNRDVDALVKEINSLYGAEYVTRDQLTLIGQAEDCSFYLREPGAEEMANIENLDEEFKNECERLMSLREDIVKNLKFARVERPVNESIGKKVSFEAVDFDGNKVTSDEIFRQNEFTMVNVWATWCYYCIEEFPDLEELNQQLAEKNCGIIGLCGDAETDELLNTAKELLSRNNVTYLNIRPFDGWEETFVIESGWPTSFFVDKTGTIVAPPVSGARLYKYQERFDELLSRDTTAQNAASSENTAGAYNIYVSDQDSNPVEGVKVQFCTDKICKVASTDSNGLASFSDPEGKYEVHILGVPDGYKDNEEVYYTEAVYGDLNITIEKE